MRHGHLSQLATLDCTSSRRSTVMCALPRATAVTTVYQRDSSSKRPRSSVVFAVRALARASPSRRQRMSTASRASRPAGGAFGAPGPRAHPLTRRLLCRQADACRRATSLRRRVGVAEWACRPPVLVQRRVSRFLTGPADIHEPRGPLRTAARRCAGEKGMWFRPRADSESGS